MTSPSSAAAGEADRFQVRVPKTAELVAGHIRRRIVLGELEADEALPPESALMEQFSISRPTLREAFRILESEGLIRVRRGARGGARVQVPDTDVAARYAGLVLQHRGTTLDDVLEARVIIEAPAARMLAQRRDRGRLADELTELLEQLGSNDPARFHEFNAAVVALTRNETLVLVTAMLEHLSQAAALNYTRNPHEGDERLARKAHRTRLQLIDLIRAGDADGAEALWRSHLTAARRIFAGDGGQRVVDLFN